MHTLLSSISFNPSLLSFLLLGPYSHPFNIVMYTTHTTSILIVTILAMTLTLWLYTFTYTQTSPSVPQLFHTSDSYKQCIWFTINITNITSTILLQDICSTQSSICLGTKLYSITELKYIQIVCWYHLSFPHPTCKHSMLLSYKILPLVMISVSELLLFSSVAPP